MRDDGRRTKIREQRGSGYIEVELIPNQAFFDVPVF